ncbi:MAG TPA: hypothetical protein VMV17_23440 [Streptosporangiaceae bacterium]|nr:hypothetical protein [Streptosporangiaceae bacterium]
MVHASEDPAVALDKLAGALAALGCQVPALAPHGRPPSLTVTNPAAPRMSETVMVDAGWFWWPWADRIAPLTDAAAAAGRVARVLRAGPQ